MQVKVYKPSHPVLKKLIDNISILTRTVREKPTVFTAFPNYITFVSVNYSAKTTVSGKNIKIRHSKKQGVDSILILDFINCGLVEYSGKIFEITICFKPLGINAFLEKELVHYRKEVCTPFYPFNDYQNHMLDISLMKRHEEIVRALENYLLLKYRGFHHPFLNNLLEDILDESQEMTISELARKYHISRTTLNKQFYLHLCTTPNQFKKIVRFRRALKSYRLNSSKKKLTDLTYQSSYYDQSHMIKDFKTLTRHVPKSFFSKVTQLEGGLINWMFT